ncbi:hypothetical protein GCM10011529_15180 [Polymorphobacter glacialis]|uniref:Polysaccharide biosynthesis protein C-terminal domain-containing protein n=1 Tax=Sandarakinorhabdus glacialis TaxID=1614636 RepID=A0A916ZR19_9SPHN|nr:hypothetical protein GCM10011529_15180 [Polymorphobacter glacialis]
MQVTAIAAAFGTVAQISVARHVASANARGDGGDRDEYVSTALVLAGLGGALLIALMAIAGLNIARLLPQVPSSLQQMGGLALLTISAGASLTMPGGVITGQFMGEQRSHVPNAIVFVGRLAQGALIVIAAVATSNLMAVALAHMTGNLLIFGAQVTAQNRLSSHVVVRRSLASRLVARRIWTFSATLLLWQVAALVINGVDLVVLGRIDFPTVPFFAVAATASAIFAGVVGSIYNAFLPVASRIHVSGNGKAMETFLHEGLRLGATFTLMVAIPLILCNEPILRMWVGHEYAARSSLVMSILMVAFLVRTSVMMYVICSVASDTHGKGWPGPVLEAIANLALSIGLGIWLGATGVALGTLASAGIGVAAWLALDPLKSVTGARAGWRVFVRALMRPALMLMPIGLLGMLVPSAVRATWESLALVIILTGGVGWFATLTRKDRVAMASWLGLRLAHLSRRGSPS